MCRGSIDRDGVEGMPSIQGLAKAGTEVGGRIRIKGGTVRRTDIGEPMMQSRKVRSIGE